MFSILITQLCIFFAQFMPLFCLFHINFFVQFMPLFCLLCCYWLICCHYYFLNVKLVIIGLTKSRLLMLNELTARHCREAIACSKEEDMTPCCFFNCVRNVKPRPLDTNDVYQQFEIVPYGSLCKFNSNFYAKSIADNGYPPCHLRRTGWEIYSKTPKIYDIS